MKLTKEEMTRIVYRGYLFFGICCDKPWNKQSWTRTYYIPGYAREDDSSSEIYDEHDYPDEWFCKLTNKMIPPFGKQRWSLYFTQAGWEENREDQRVVFETQGDQRGHTWEDYEVMVEKHFQKVEKAMAKELAKVSVYQAFVV